MELAEQVIRQAIARDVAWVGRYAADSRDPTRRECAGVISLCTMPYMALFAHESRVKLTQIAPELVPEATADYQEIAARSRNSLKLFDDNRRRIDGQLDYFRDEIRTAHTHFFINRVNRLFRFLAKDLGRFTYDGKLITTSHVATFHLGLPPSELVWKRGPEMKAHGEAFGRYFGSLGAEIPDSGGETFYSTLEPRKMGRLGDDLRAATYYEHGFEGEGNADLNTLLTVFRCMVNFASSAVPPTAANNAIDYSEFKIRYVTAFHVLSSLRLLRNDSQCSLSPHAATHLARILDCDEARSILSEAAIPFRNTLIHYGLDSRVPEETIDLTDPLFGLAPHYFTSCAGPIDLAKLVDRALLKTAAGLNDWAERP
jgi:hypothetical protein